MSTLVRIPDQFTPGGVAVETSATPTCCCCCCCVATLTTVGTVLPAGYASEVRKAGRRPSPAAIVALACTPLLLVLPLLLTLISSDRWLRDLGLNLLTVELIMVLVAGVAVVLISRLGRAPRPAMALARLLSPLPLIYLEMVLVFVTGGVFFWLSILAFPLLILLILKCYR